MKKEYYTVHSYGFDGGRETIKVLAANHFQHIWSETVLQGVSVAGDKRLTKLFKNNEKLTIEVGNREIRLVNWE